MFGFGALGQYTLGESGIATTVSTASAATFTPNTRLSTQDTDGVRVTLTTTTTTQTS